MAHKITSIEVTFPEAVEVPDAQFQQLVSIVSDICKAYEATHPGRVMWPFGIGCKPTYIPMTAEEEKTRGMEFDESVLSIECYERADYKWKCAKCGMEQGDHKEHITQPPAGDCEFTVSNG